jgi:hypothetical protein
MFLKRRGANRKGNLMDWWYLIPAMLVLVIFVADHFYHIGYSDAIEDVKKTGRIPELEDIP